MWGDGCCFWGEPLCELLLLLGEFLMQLFCLCLGGLCRPGLDLPDDKCRSFETNCPCKTEGTSFSELELELEFLGLNFFRGFIVGRVIFGERNAKLIDLVRKGIDRSLQSFIRL